MDVEQTLHEINAKLDDLSDQHEKIINSQNAIIDMANTLVDMAKSFQMPGPLAAMFGMGKKPDGDT